MCGKPEGFLRLDWVRTHLISKQSPKSRACVRAHEQYGNKNSWGDTIQSTLHLTQITGCALDSLLWNQRLLSNSVGSFSEQMIAVALMAQVKHCLQSYCSISLLYLALCFSGFCRIANNANDDARVLPKEKGIFPIAIERHRRNNIFWILSIMVELSLKEILIWSTPYEAVLSIATFSPFCSFDLCWSFWKRCLLCNKFIQNCGFAYVCSRKVYF